MNESGEYHVASQSETGEDRRCDKSGTDQHAAESDSVQALDDREKVDDDQERVEQCQQKRYGFDEVGHTIAQNVQDNRVGRKLE